jgi:hypothetical protein
MTSQGSSGDGDGGSGDEGPVTPTATLRSGLDLGPASPRLKVERPESLS